MVRPMRKTRAPTQSQRAIGHIAALQSIATMFVMHAMVGRSTLQFKMPRLDAYAVDGASLQTRFQRHHPVALRPNHRAHGDSDIRWH